MNIKQLKTKIKTVKQMFKNNFFIKEWKEIDKDEKIFYWSTREILTIVCILTIAILFLNYMFFAYQNHINVLNPFGSTLQSTNEFLNILKTIEKAINIVVITICSFILVPTSLLLIKIIYKNIPMLFKNIWINIRKSKEELKELENIQYKIHELDNHIKKEKTQSLENLTSNKLLLTNSRETHIQNMIIERDYLLDVLKTKTNN